MVVLHEYILTHPLPPQPDKHAVEMNILLKTAVHH